MSLYQKIRPSLLKNMLGNKAAVESLVAEVNDPNRPHAYLFSGTYGCGKTTAARAFAHEIEALPIEMNMGSTRGIDTIRGIAEELQYAKIQNTVWILDEAHSLTNDAVNALLKLLEDTPSWAYFILCTTEPQKIAKAIGSRCAMYTFKPLSPKLTYNLINETIKNEKITISDEIIDEILNASGGIPRKTLVLLETIAGMKNVVQQIETIREASHAIDESVEIIELMRFITFGSSWQDTRSILSKLRKEGADPEKLRISILAYMSSVLLTDQNNKKVHETYERMRAFTVPLSDRSGFSAFVFQCYQSFSSRGIPF